MASPYNKLESILSKAQRLKDVIDDRSLSHATEVADDYLRVSRNKFTIVAAEYFRKLGYSLYTPLAARKVNSYDTVTTTSSYFVVDNTGFEWLDFARSGLRAQGLNVYGNGHQPLRPSISVALSPEPRGIILFPENVDILDELGNTIYNYASNVGEHRWLSRAKPDIVPYAADTILRAVVSGHDESAQSQQPPVAH